MNTNLHLSTGHDATVTKVEGSARIALLPHANDYTAFWEVKFGGRVWTVGTGYKGLVTHAKERKQFVVWYHGGAFWASYGTSIGDAVEKAIDCAYLYA